MATDPVPGLGEMVGVVRSHERSDGGPLILRLSRAAWIAATGAGVIGGSPDRWPAPAEPGAYRRVAVIGDAHLADGAWQLLDAGAEIIASGDIAGQA